MRTNYLAVIVAAIAYWLLGAVWYSVLFGNAWMQLEHMTADQVKAVSGAQVGTMYGIGFVMNLVIAFFLAQLCGWRAATTAARGAALGILLWIGFVGPITYTTHMYEMRPWPLFAINQFYPLAGLCLMGAIIGAWPKKSAG